MRLEMSMRPSVPERKALSDTPVSSCTQAKCAEASFRGLARGVDGLPDVQPVARANFGWPPLVLNLLPLTEMPDSDSEMPDFYNPFRYGPPSLFRHAPQRSVYNTIDTGLTRGPIAMAVHSDHAVYSSKADGQISTPRYGRP